MRARRSADEDTTDWTAASAEAVAVRLLARREHSRHELARKLAARGVPDELIDTVLGRLAEHHLQSDDRYAESLVTSRAGRGQGPVRIGRELVERGVAPESVEQALSEAGKDWFDLARQVRRRRFGVALPKDWKSRAQQSRFLEYRGFTGEQIRYALGGDDEAP